MNSDKIARVYTYWPRFPGERCSSNLFLLNSTPRTAYPVFRQRQRVRQRYHGQYTNIFLVLVGHRQNLSWYLATNTTHFTPISLKVFTHSSEPHCSSLYQIWRRSGNVIFISYKILIVRRNSRPCRLRDPPVWLQSLNNVCNSLLGTSTRIWSIVLIMCWVLKLVATGSNFENDLLSVFYWLYFTHWGWITVVHDEDVFGHLWESEYWHMMLLLNPTCWQLSVFGRLLYFMTIFIVHEFSKTIGVIATLLANWSGSYDHNGRAVISLLSKMSTVRWTIFINYIPYRKKYYCEYHLANRPALQWSPCRRQMNRSIVGHPSRFKPNRPAVTYCNIW